MPWSKGSTIAFSMCTEISKTDQCLTDIYLMNLNGGDRSKVTYTEDDNKMPQWSPDGYKMSFISNRDGSPKIYVMKFDKSSYCRWGNCWITRLTSQASEVSEHFHSWHPDGDRLIFLATDRFSSSKVTQVYFDVDGDFLHTSSQPLEIGISSTIPNYPMFPSWSPDGSRIMFVQNVKGKDIVFTSGIDGKNSSQITKSDFDSTMPVWSPDGKKIVFASTRAGDFDIYVVNSDGSNLKQITNQPGNELDPDWSPDSKAIIYSGDGFPTTKHPEARSREIFTIHLSEKHKSPRRITHNDVDENHPVWAPNLDD